MNKKIIITIATVAVIAVGSFIGYNVYQNSKQEVPAKTTEITSTDKVVENDKEKAPTEEQKKDTEVVLDAEQAKIVFEKFQNALFEIDYSNDAQVKKQEEIINDTVHPALKDWVLKSYNQPGKDEKAKLSLVSLKADEIKEIGYSLNDNKYKAFEFIYSCVVDTGDKKQELKDKSAVILLDTDNKYKIIEYNISAKK